MGHTATERTGETGYLVILCGHNPCAGRTVGDVTVTVAVEPSDGGQIRRNSRYGRNKSRGFCRGPLNHAYPAARFPKSRINFVYS